MCFRLCVHRQRSTLSVLFHHGSGTLRMSPMTATDVLLEPQCSSFKEGGLLITRQTWFEETYYRNYPSTAVKAQVLSSFQGFFFLDCMQIIATIRQQYQPRTGRAKLNTDIFDSMLLIDLIWWMWQHNRSKAEDYSVLFTGNCVCSVLSEEPNRRYVCSCGWVTWEL